MSGSNLSTLTASGDAHAIGRALGEASAAALRDIVPTIGRFQALMREWRGTERLRALEAAARSVWPQYVREIEGLAHGAGVAFETVFLWNCRGDLPESGCGAPRGNAAGCTTVAVPPREGRPALVAHNEDDAPELHGHCRIVDVRPDDGPGFVSFYSPGLLPGHAFAVNRAGLVQAVNDLRPEDCAIGGAIGVPRHLVCRAVLDCEGLDAALACIRDPDRASGFHHTLARAGDRRLLSVEAPASGCEVVEVDAPCAHANHLLHERFAPVPQTIAASSRSRQTRADALIAGGALDHGDPLCVLGDVGGCLPIRRREKDCGDAGFTLATAVFRVAEGGVDYEVFDEIMHPPVHRGELRVEPGPVRGRSEADPRPIQGLLDRHL
ncbi:MAG: C45 family autoproteolytic acyltransferase/hydrolase [Thiotrichales bacterium]|nr:C45 family autoproteolytic acyltransferase/hydrolase [Thiotrichales bacterium]